MIGYLFGKVVHSDGEEAILLTESGLGISIHFNAPLTQDANLGLFISHIIRENSQDLFGFLTLKEKKIFEWLLKVKGVGPRTAFSLLNSLGALNLCKAILKEDKQALQQAPGIGFKMASQIILDLKGKITKIIDLLEEVQIPSTLNSTANPNNAFESDLKEQMLLYENYNPNFLKDVLLACQELGFTEKETLPMAKKIFVEHNIQSSEQLLQLLLKNL